MTPKQTKADDRMVEVGRLYRDPRQPGSFGGVGKFFKSLKKAGHAISQRDLQKWMQDEDLYQLHKPSRKSFPRRPIIVQGIDHLWQADLSDLSSLKRYNNNKRFLLFVIDGFSKYAWVKPMKDKTSNSVANAMREILNATDRKPLHLQTDKGGEFLNQPFKNLMVERNINFFTSQNEETKAAFVERLQRTYKSKMYRYFTDRNTLRYADVLDDLTHSYNNTYHTSIGMSPAEVDKKNESAVRRRLCDKWRKASRIREKKKKTFQEGDKVRISVARQTFRKGYLPQWTEEIFTVHKCLKTKPKTYKVIDDNGEVLHGSFYFAELQRVPKKEDRAYRIEEVLKKRKKGKRKQLFVKWKGYPSTFNSWIWEEDLV